ncbi:hypothetical protein [Coleofasciculus sp. F4-SAH-05]|uniref:hypothetical protein n=1 Tax=Coleofasciculus TaxID=669368 RepID=UPI0032F790BE
MTVKRVEHELQTVSAQLDTICIDRIRKLNAGALLNGLNKQQRLFLYFFCIVCVSNTTEL